MNAYLTANDFLELISDQLPSVMLAAAPPDRSPEPGSIVVWPSSAPLPDGCDAHMMLGDDGAYYCRVTREVFQFLKGDLS